MADDPFKLPEYLEDLLRRKTRRRSFLAAGAATVLGLSWRSRSGHAEFGDPNDDPDLTEEQAKAWFLTQGMGALTQRNEVVGLIDGPETFASMRAAIATATTNQHFVYFLNWWMTDGFATDPATGATTALNSILRTASRDNVQIRAMLWDQAFKQNTAEVGNINALANGAAILDNRTLNIGSHHQKVLIVYGSQGLICFCGGIDWNPDRIHAKGAAANKGGDTSGAPLHDVHSRVEGPAAFDLLQIFIERWNDHPDRVDLDKAKGALRGATTARPAATNEWKWAQVGRTYGNGARHPGIGGNRFWRTTGYTFAPNGEQTAAKMILNGIAKAKKFIYVEDQYFVDTIVPAGLDVRAALVAALGRQGFQHLTVLVPHSSLHDGTGQTQYPFRRSRLIAALRAADPGGKFRIFNLKPAGAPHTYVHAKAWFFDDEFCVIGSANTNRRSFTHDSEAVVGIVDQKGSGAPKTWMPHALRMRLWAEHLNATEANVRDPIASAGLWTTPPQGAKIEPYNAAINHGGGNTDFNWNTNVDPDGS